MQTILCSRDSYSVEDRAVAEQDESRRQIIPVAIVFDGLGRVLSYERKGTERRLHGKRSVLIGGHVDVDDRGPGFEYGTVCADSIVLGALKREIHEELGLTGDEIVVRSTPVAKISLFGSQVNSVHTMVLFNAELKSGYECRFSDEICNPEWEYAKPTNLESWSSVAWDMAPVDRTSAEDLFARECEILKGLFREKNRSYGNSCLDPVSIYSEPSSSSDLIRKQIDHKLSRLMRGNFSIESRQKTEIDVLIYKIMLRIAEPGSAK